MFHFSAPWRGCLDRRGRAVSVAVIRMVAVMSSAVLLGACSGEQASPASGMQTGPGAQPSTPVAAVEIARRDLSRQISLSGTVEPRVTVRLAARVSGAVETVTADIGQTVRAGELLATLDTAEARAELSRARAEQESARLEFRRAEELRARGVVSAAQFETARVALQVAESEQALWRTRVEFGRVASPLDAVVTARHVEPGEAVQAQATLFDLAALDELVVRVGVSELDVVHLAPGQQVPVHLDAMPEHALEGTIRRIFPMAETSNRLTTVEIALPADATELGVRPGFLARIRTSVDLRPDARVVPSAAVGRNGEARYVFVIDDGRLSRREIVTGVTRGQWTEVIEGLEVGEMVLASNPIEMRDGQAVRIVAVREQAHAH